MARLLHYMLALSRYRCYFYAGIALLTGLSSSTVVLAAPITFGFTTKIDRSLSATPFDPGFDFEIGDDLSGIFTFLPNSGDGSKPFRGDQTSSFYFRVNGAPFSIPHYSILVSNDIGVSHLPFNLLDEIEVIGNGLTTPRHDIADNIDPLASAFDLTLQGDGDSSPSATITDDISIWNNHDYFRTFNIFLRDGSGGLIVIGGDVGPLFVVPEPATVFLATFSLVALVAYRSASRKHC